MTGPIAASAELGLGEHGPHIVVILLPTAYLLLLALREVRHAHLDVAAITDRWLRRWLSAAVAAAVITAVVDVLIGIASLGRSPLTAMAVGVSAAASLLWAITVSRAPTHSNVQLGAVGAAVITALWAITLAVGPVGVGTEVGNLLAWAPLMSGTILIASTAAARRWFTAEEPQDQVLTSAAHS